MRMIVQSEFGGAWHYIGNAGPPRQPLARAAGWLRAAEARPPTSTAAAASTAAFAAVAAAATAAATFAAAATQASPNHNNCHGLFMGLLSPSPGSQLLYLAAGSSQRLSSLSFGFCCNSAPVGHCWKDAVECWKLDKGHVLLLTSCSSSQTVAAASKPSKAEVAADVVWELA
jgi:hypothetical protein